MITVDDNWYKYQGIFTSIYYICVHILCVYCIHIYIIYMHQIIAEDITSHQPCLFCCHVFLSSSKDSKVHAITRVPRSRASTCKWQEITESESEPDSALSISEFLRIDKHLGEKKDICYGHGISMVFGNYTLRLWGFACCQTHHLLGPTIKYRCMCVNLFVTLLLKLAAIQFTLFCRVYWFEIGGVISVNSLSLRDPFKFTAATSFRSFCFLVQRAQKETNSPKYVVSVLTTSGKPKFTVFLGNIFFSPTLKKTWNIH